MHLRKLITRSFFHYLGGNMLAAGGLAVAAAVITGAFIIGDSLSHSLEKAVNLRLGGITHSVTAGDRLFTMEMGDRFATQSGMQVSRALLTEGMVIAGGGRERLNRIQVVGVDDTFSTLLGSAIDHGGAGPGEVIVSRNMARRLQLEPGDHIMLRMKGTGVIPMNTPLVSDAGQTVTRRVRVAAIAGDEDYGRFNMRVSQTAPYNVFVDIGWLNTVMGLDGMANAIFLASEDAVREDIEGYLRDAFEPEDGNLVVRYRSDLGMTGISSERVFIEEHLSGVLAEAFPSGTRILTYFVNSIEKGTNDTPYSFIAATERYGLEPGEIVINEWLAGDIGAALGDTLLVRYFETGPRRELEERDVSLIVSGIIDMEEAAADSILMPFLPGLSDAGSCRDWDAGVPVSLDRIRDKDEDYWDEYRGTPKGYISLEQGQLLWTNRFGNLTSYWLPSAPGDLQSVRNAVSKAADPTEMGFQVNELRKQGLEAAAGGVDFGTLFGGLGFFVMLAGIMLFFLLMLFNLERRSDQVRLFSAMGYPKSLVRKIYLGEWMLVALAGGVGGLFLAAGYGALVRYALMEVWQDIVRTDLLVLVIRPQSLVWGLFISLAAAFLVTVFGTDSRLLERRTSGNGSVKSIRTTGGPHKQANTRNHLMTAASLVFAGAGATVLLLQLFAGGDPDPFLFFVSGGLLLVAVLLFVRILLLLIGSRGYDRIDLLRLSIRNLARNSTRSLLVITLLALGMFVVISTGSFITDAAREEMEPTGGSGGFLFVAESTVPVLYNLNSRETQLELNIPPDVEFVQFMAGYADDASCLNLNEVAHPRIIAADPSHLEGRFSFARGSEWLDSNNPWQSLNKQLSADRERPRADLPGRSIDIIPAIADQTVIQWGLNKRVGDTLFYTNERGREIGLLLIGGLANSVFQGNVLISEEHFLSHFPSTSGSSFFLVDASHDRLEALQEELAFIFSDHGWEMTTTAQRLNEFNSVENTYLAIFMMLGALGVLLGVAGLAVVMARSVTERRAELALYASLGYRKSQITLVIFREYLVLLAGGLVAGVLPALIAIIPSLMPDARQINLGFLAWIIIAIVIHGLFWLATTLVFMVKTGSLATALRND